MITTYETQRNLLDFTSFSLRKRLYIAWLLITKGQFAITNTLNTLTTVETK